MTLVEGMVVKVEGEPGLYRACAQAKDKSGSGAWWFLPCDRLGRWNQKGGWRAFHPSRCSAPKPVGTRRHYGKGEK